MKDLWGPLSKYSFLLTVYGQNGNTTSWWTSMGFKYLWVSTLCKVMHKVMRKVMCKMMCKMRHELGHKVMWEVMWEVMCIFLTKIQHVAFKISSQEMCIFKKINNKSIDKLWRKLIRNYYWWMAVPVPGHLIVQWPSN